MSRWAVPVVALVGLAVLLTACDEGTTTAACNVDVDTAELREEKAAAGIEDCPDLAGEADLPDLELSCLAGGTPGSLADVEGPAIVNFWASNCAPCRTEMPVLQEFHERHGDRVAVIGVDFLETYPGAAVDLARRTGATYPSFADACGDLQEAGLIVPGLPSFAFVRADGSVERADGGVDSLAEIEELAEDKLGIELARGPRERPPRGRRTRRGPARRPAGLARAGRGGGPADPGQRADRVPAARGLPAPAGGRC
ncbi:TlpA disulfide reductase family protein [Nocardioides sp. TF02-7]|uniref:TlpA family protein disulfide reductase n=1 Tax=Nocardioides sp. TF02-7 TaxID=2917724 RepID=UPI001F0543B8|nr:TlpA disulfide reductase family protein [Nocardioides sp. TF02-7]UMG93924.1 TlpA family protein disulfide reductase [Nocardioides sp. TF02-7]